MWVSGLGGDWCQYWFRKGLVPIKGMLMEVDEDNNIPVQQDGTTVLQVYDATVGDVAVSLVAAAAE